MVLPERTMDRCADAGPISPRSPRLRLLDLFCCAGGAGKGYARAGFDVTGVDIKRHKRSPHRVIEADALSLDPAWIAANFDAVHASPKCQGQTRDAPRAGPQAATSIRSPRPSSF
jgi:site-specific DNA-cytosine methylase